MRQSLRPRVFLLIAVCVLSASVPLEAAPFLMNLADGSRLISDGGLDDLDPTDSVRRNNRTLQSAAESPPLSGNGYLRSRHPCTRRADRLRVYSN